MNENKLMDRVEVRYKVEHTGEPTPNRDAMRTALSSSLGVAKDRVVVSDMDSEYGKGASDGYAKVYASVDSAKKHDKNYALVRNGLAQKKEKKKAAAAAPAKKKSK
jgi:small subunit ribosomal protein S24e